MPDDKDQRVIALLNELSQYGRLSPWRYMIRYDLPTLDTVLKIVATIVAILALFVGSGFFYNAVWHVPRIAVETVAPWGQGYEWSGVTIRNWGRASAHDVLLRVSALPVAVVQTDVRGDESFSILEGVPGIDSFVVKMERISSGASMTISIRTQGPVALAKHLSLTADDVERYPVAAPVWPPSWVLVLGVVVAIVAVSWALSLMYYANAYVLGLAQGMGIQTIRWVATIAEQRRRKRPEGEK